MVTWHLTSIDPDTMEATTNPLAGFLPPNTTPPAGQGSVVFTVMPKAGLATGTIIRNQASVVFDVNAPIATPLWSNTIDSTPPVSHVVSLPATQPTDSFLVVWSGTDIGSGILDHTIYVSDNGGPFTAWQTNTTDTQAMYTGVVGHTYGFYSIARDLVGNVENAQTTAEATTTVISSACAIDGTSQFKVVPGGFRFNNGTQQFMQTVTPQQLTLTPIQLPLSLVLDNLSSNATLANKTGTTIRVVRLPSTLHISTCQLEPAASFWTS